MLLVYYLFKEAQPSAGVWRADKFSVPVFLKKWTVLNIDSMRTKFPIIKYVHLLCD